MKQFGQMMLCVVVFVGLFGLTATDAHAQVVGGGQQLPNSASMIAVQVEGEPEFLQTEGIIDTGYGTLDATYTDRNKDGFIDGIILLTSIGGIYRWNPETDRYEEAGSNGRWIKVILSWSLGGVVTFVGVSADGGVCGQY